MTIKEGRLSLRVSMEDKKLIQKRAIDLEMTLSEYIMSLVKKDLEEVQNE